MNIATTPKFKTVRARLNFMLVVFVLFITGCTNTLRVEGDFPRPLVAKMPNSIGVMYKDEFKKYKYEETNRSRSRWIIEMGGAQTELFNAILPHMFDTVTEVKGVPVTDPVSGLQLVMVPMVDDFQYTLPSETRVKIYEVWLKYNVQVFEPNGTIVADWILTAYGKTPSGFMQSDEAALNQAIVVALRDAGVNLALNFSRVPEVRAWLEQH